MKAWTNSWWHWIPSPSLTRQNNVYVTIKGFLFLLFFFLMAISLKLYLWIFYFYFFFEMCILRTCYPPDLSVGGNESRISPNPCRSCREKPGEKLRDDTAQERWHKPLSLPQSLRRRSTPDQHLHWTILFILFFLNICSSPDSKISGQLEPSFG